jgi:hypothetical protein
LAAQDGAILCGVSPEVAPVLFDDDIGTGNFRERRRIIRDGCLGRVPLDDARPPVLAFVLVHLGGLGVELGGHQAQTLGAREIEAASRDAEAVFGLATEELGGQHQLFCFFFSGVGSIQ